MQYDDAQIQNLTGRDSMPCTTMNRRDWLTAGGALAGATAALSSAPALAAPGDSAPPLKVKFCLNTSTISGQKIPLPEEVTVAAEAGYDGIEPWLREIQAYVDGGGKLPDLRKQIEDSGLTVESAIGFANWIVDDEAQRAAGIEQLKRDMELVLGIGGTRIAAPPVGAHQKEAARIDLFAVAERYRAILEAGAQVGVTPQVEIWGFSPNLSRLGEAVFVAIESGHPDACVLPDIYHIYRGGSDFAGLKLLSGAGVHVFHVNDYPTSKPRTEAVDADRVYPGDGNAPLADIVAALRSAGFQGALSLELFNRDYWKQDVKEVARTGLAKMKAMVS
jgi:sugar phosphate isomerase/epimerase